jgi:hypothetical protein
VHKITAQLGYQTIKRNDMTKTLGKAVTVATVLSLTLFASNARAAVDLTIGIGSTTDSLGYDFPGDNNGGGQANTAVAIVTELLTLSLGQTGVAGTGAISGTLSRSDNVFSPLPAPTTTGDDVLGTETSITLSGNYTYLEAKYGNNEMVWYIGNIPSGTTIDIPSDGTGSDFGKTGSGLSDETLLDPFTPSTRTAPDGAMTLGLLGGSMTLLEVLRRKLAKN